MKKKYFTPEMEEMEMENLVLLDATVVPEKKPVVECPDDEEA